MTDPLKHLAKDPVMKKLIAQFKLEERPKVELTSEYIFNKIIQNILGQQLSGKAADTITGRIKDLFGKKWPTPKELLEMPDEKIRAAGSSWAKIKYIKNVARAVLGKSLDLENLQNLSDDEVKARLVAIKGIGPWTAEMLLMFTLNREDVFSFGDMGLQNALYKHYGVKKGDLGKMLKISDAWKPHRTTACLILWQSLESS